MAEVARLSIQVTADTGRAIAQLSALQRRLESLSGSSAHVSGAMGRMANSLDQGTAAVQRQSRAVNVLAGSMDRLNGTSTRAGGGLTRLGGAATRAGGSVNSFNNSVTRSVNVTRIWGVSLATIAHGAIALAPALVAATGALGGLTAAFGVAGIGIGSFMLALERNNKGVPHHMAIISKAMQGWRQELSNITKTPFTAWARTLANTVLPMLTPAVKATASALTTLALQFGKMMERVRDTGVWDRLVAAMRPIVTQIGLALINFFEGLLYLMEAFLPLGMSMTSGLNNMAASFKKWAASVDETKGFQEFINKVKTDGPRILEIFGNLVAALAKVAYALSPLGMLYLEVANAVAKLILAAPPDLILAMASAWVAVRTAMLGMMIVTKVQAAWTAFMAVWAASRALFIAHPVGLLITALAALVAGIVYLATQTQFFQTVWSFTWNVVKTVGLAVWDALKVAWTAFVNAIVTVWNAVSGALVAAWNAVWNGMKAVADAIWGGMRLGWQVFIVSLQTIWTAVSGALAAAWSAVWNAIQAVATAVWSGMQIAWQTLCNIFTTTWNASGAVLSAAWSAIWNALSAVATTIWNAIRVAWQALCTAFQVIWTSVSGALSAAWSAVWNAMSAVATTIWNAMRTAWQAFINVLSTLWSTASSALSASWTATWNAIRTVATGVWNALQTAASAFWNALRSIFTTGQSALQSGWQAVWNAIRAALTAVFNAMNALARTFWSAFQSIFTASWNALRSGWQAIWNAIRSILLTVFNAMNALARTFWNAFRNIFTAAWNALRSGWQAIWNAIRTILLNVFNAMNALARTFWNAFRNIFTAAWNALRSGWQSVWTAIRNFLTSTFDAMNNLARTFWNAFRNIFNSAMAAFRSAWQATWNTVRDIADRFMDGIRDAFRACWEAIRSTAQSIWNSIGNVIEEAINGIIGIVNKIIDGFNNIASAVNIDVEIGHIPTVTFAYGGIVGGPPAFAAGGVVNLRRGGTLAGYAPGRDTVPAMLSKGEGVLTPEAVRGLGGPGFVHSANRTFAGHRGAGKGASKLPGFATGGMVGVQHFAVGGITAQALAAAGVPLSMVMQGEYSTGVAASAGTHDRGGAVDIGSTSPQVLARLRAAGFAAWIRGPAQGMTPHIHAVLIGHPDLSPQAAAQVADFLAGGDGLGSGGGGGIAGAIMEALGNLGGVLRDIALGNDNPIAEMIGSLFGMLGESAIREAFDWGEELFNDFSNPAGRVGEIMLGVGRTIFSGLVDFLVQKDSEATPDFSGGFVGGGNVQMWAPLAAQALARAGLPASELGEFLALMQAESGGNPMAINLWDSNAAAGQASRGLMQVIPSTFAAHRDPSLPNNIFDPLANMTAAARYIRARYGMDVPGSPYAKGTNHATRGWHWVGERGPELVWMNGGEKVMSHRDSMEYVVKRGDTLWDIARRFYGNGQMWRDIYEANKGTIGSNPNLIYPNQKFDIPNAGSGTNITVAQGAVTIPVQGNITPEVMADLEETMENSLRMALMSGTGAS